jgi:hypothetical protein
MQQTNKYSFISSHFNGILSKTGTGEDRSFVRGTKSDKFWGNICANLDRSESS